MPDEHMNGHSAELLERKRQYEDVMRVQAQTDDVLIPAVADFRRDIDALIEPITTVDGLLNAIPAMEKVCADVAENAEVNETSYAIICAVYALMNVAPYADGPSAWPRPEIPEDRTQLLAAMETYIHGAEQIVGRGYRQQLLSALPKLFAGDSEAELSFHQTLQAIRSAVRANSMFGNERRAWYKGMIALCEAEAVTRLGATLHDIHLK